MFMFRKRVARQDSAACPLCEHDADEHVIVQGVSYFDCETCDFIFADPALLRRIDDGESLRVYDADYWRNELTSARERSYGSSLARAAEAVLYCRIPVRRFIDIGTGPGYLLDALSAYLPSHRDCFYGVERFPPNEADCTTHANFLRSDLGQLGMQFECGVCIEVIEHLTPRMAGALASALAASSVPGSLFLFNTGLTEYVRKEDPGYLDPYGRGHITSWSVSSARKIFEREGFVVHAISGKTWAFVVERPGPSSATDDVRNRIWSAPVENRRFLSDPGMGEVMYILGRESARAY
ncbi:hypothetical protein ABIE51_000862 [Lysobacter sp. OAE881]|uniref:methyltransferase domain-containing protein n=1 Tax=Lysobacter sp. OAE881 TaxID=2663813 RepID=UPI00178B52D4